MNGWKQPTPTDINFNDKFTAVERAVFREILSLCQNEDTVLHFIHASKHFSVELKRGQCIFKVSRFAKDFEMDRKKIRKSIEILSKWYSEMDIKAMPFGLVITMKEYDDIIKMNSVEDNKRTIKGQSKDNKGTANKSDKSEESEKKEEEKKPFRRELTFEEEIAQGYRDAQGFFTPKGFKEIVGWEVIVE